jgi:RNA polymerase sigma factor (sigma-70 family)
MDLLSDEELVYYVRLGNGEAKRLLFFRYEKKIGNYLYKNRFLLERLGYTFDDLKMLIWECVEKSLSRYSFEGGTFYSYCFMTLKSKVIDLTRKKAVENELVRVRTYHESPDLDICDSMPSKGNDVDMAIYINYILNCVREMGEEHYQVIKMVYEGYSYDEIAKELHTSNKRVNNLVTNIRKRLRNRFN